MLVRDRPLSINLFKAESRSHQVAQLPAVQIGASASNESKSITNVIAGRDLQVFEFEFPFAFKLWLPISPTLPVRPRTVVGQWGQDVIDHGVFGMVTENCVEPAFARVLRPKLEDFANVFGVLHMALSLKDQRDSNEGPKLCRSYCKVGIATGISYLPAGGWGPKCSGTLGRLSVPIWCNFPKNRLLAQNRSRNPLQSQNQAGKQKCPPESN